MRHSNSGKKLSRTPSHRKALFRNLTKALLTHGKIRTTEIKAKALRRVVEPLITLALRNDLHARRQAYRELGSHQLVKRLFDVLGPAFVGVPGGFTRVYKLAQPRRGDNAAMAVIELTHGMEEASAGDSKVKAAPKAAEAIVDVQAEEASAEKPKRARKKAEADAETTAE